MEFSISQSEHEYITVDVLGYERSPVGELYDDNWLRIQIRVSVGGFRGNMSASILTTDLIGFAVGLRSIFEKLSGSAEFSTIEKQLSLRLLCDRTGHVSLSGSVSDHAGIGNRLEFSLRLDQSDIASSVRQLDAITQTFPERK
jgi:hypothetical protein